MENLRFELGVFAVYFLNIYPRTFLEASCLNSTAPAPPPPPPPAPCELEVPVNAFGQVVVTENIHKVAAFFDDHSGCWGKQSIGKVGFQGCVTRVECT